MSARKVVLPCHAKINLGLRVLGTRPDGYHDIRSILHTIDLHDDLEVVPDSRIRLEIENDWACGRAVTLPVDSRNLVVKAAAALKERLGGRGAFFRLVKRIPAGSGLGGASSDAAAALIALDRLHGLGLTPVDLHRIASDLGSDVPFFLYGGACLALGRGEEVYPLPDGPGLDLVLALPEESLGTPEVYRAWDALLTSPDNVCRVNDFAPWCLVLRGESPGVANDLEAAAVSLRPSLRTLRRALEGPGVRAVSMTGSGSAFFAICVDRAAATRRARQLRDAGLGAVTARTIGREERERTLLAAT